MLAQLFEALGVILGLTVLFYAGIICIVLAVTVLV
jgi:hypothetical protein